MDVKCYSRYRQFKHSDILFIAKCALHSVIRNKAEDINMLYVMQMEKSLHEIYMPRLRTGSIFYRVSIDYHDVIEHYDQTIYNCVST